MGKTFKSIIAVTVCVSLLFPIYARADSVDDVYTFYGLEPSPDVPDEYSDVLKNYTDAKRFVSMYAYVDLSSPDTSIQEAELESLTERFEEINAELFNGFNLTLGEILEKEEEQHRIKESMDYISRTTGYVHVNIDIPNTSNVPSFDDYKNAKYNLAKYRASKEIGHVSGLAVPCTDQASVLGHSRDSTVFEISGVTTVCSLFKGTIVSVTESTVSVQTFEDIVVTYSGLDSVRVFEGSMVDQYTPIGSVQYQFSVSLNIRDKNYDLYELLEGG